MAQENFSQLKFSVQQIMNNLFALKNKYVFDEPQANLALRKLIFSNPFKSYDLKSLVRGIKPEGFCDVKVSPYVKNL